jgi:hypothetical protein
MQVGSPVPRQATTSARPGTLNNDINRVKAAA